MWLCEGCYDSRLYRAISINARLLPCCECKQRKRCYLVVRREKA